MCLSQHTAAHPQCKTSPSTFSPTFASADPQPHGCRLPRGTRLRWMEKPSAWPWMPPCHPALCCGLRDVMDVDVPPVWSLLGCTKDCRAPNLLGCGDRDGTPHSTTPLQPSGFSIPRRRKRFIHPEAYPSEHQYMWSFTKHAQALAAASGARIGPGEENRAPSHAPDCGSTGG